MEYTKGECGCSVVISPDQKGYGIIYCPKHKAAPKLYEACCSALVEIEDGSSNHAHLILEQAIAEVEDK